MGYRNDLVLLLSRVGALLNCSLKMHSHGRTNTDAFHIKSPFLFWIYSSSSIMVYGSDENQGTIKHVQCWVVWAGKSMKIKMHFPLLGVCAIRLLLGKLPGSHWPSPVAISSHEWPKLTSGFSSQCLRYQCTTTDFWYKPVELNLKCSKCITSFLVYKTEHEWRKIHICCRVSQVFPITTLPTFGQAQQITARLLNFMH